MRTLCIAFIPDLIAGVISVCTSWLWKDVIFHRYQRETPETWRLEARAVTLPRAFCTILGAIGIACLFTLVMRFKVGIFAVGFQGSFYFAICAGTCRFFSNPPSLFTLLSSADFSTGSRLPCSLAPLYGGGSSNRPLAAVETC